MTDTAPDIDAFCRAIEAYLCQKNDGHLIRIVGPAFEHVSAWARQGIPIKVAQSGIDRYFERYYRKGPRRRPVRVEFCEADVLDAFDDWRRAVGVGVVIADADGGPDVEEPGSAPARAKRSLAARLESVVARLTVLRGGPTSDALSRSLADAVRTLDHLRVEAGAARGPARDALLEQVRAVDRRLLQAAHDSLDAATRLQLAKDAAAELAPFRDRMPAEAWAQAVRASLDRLVRQAAGLPDLDL